MYQLILTVDTKENVESIMDVLESAEQQGQIDVPFNCWITEGRIVPASAEPMDSNDQENQS